MMPERALASRMLSLPHLIIIFIVALIVFGPEKLPELARNLGRFMADFRRMSGELRGSLEENLRELERHTRERTPPSPEPLARQAPAAVSPEEAPQAAAPGENPPVPEKPADGNASPA
jgi:TatA/E family protein of Tat protein translocase